MMAEDNVLQLRKACMRIEEFCKFHRWSQDSAAQLIGSRVAVMPRVNKVTQKKVFLSGRGSKSFLKEHIRPLNEILHRSPAFHPDHFKKTKLPKSSSEIIQKSDLKDALEDPTHTYTSRRLKLRGLYGQASDNSRCSVTHSHGLSRFSAIRSFIIQRDPLLCNSLTARLFRLRPPVDSSPGCQNWAKTNAHFNPSTCARYRRSTKNTCITYNAA
jgi:hypothetical protein